MANYCPSVTEIDDKKVIFQQDHAPIQEGSYYKNVDQDFEVRLLSWSSLNPDLNPIEYLRRILAKTVYDQKKLPMKNIVKRKEKHKTRVDGYSKRNFNRLTAFNEYTRHRLYLSTHSTT